MSKAIKLAACDTELGDSFGVSVAISGSTAIVGALLDDNVAANAGSMYVFGTVPSPCLADWNDDCSVNFFDITNYIADYNAQAPAADISAPFGAFNFFDIAAFINLFNVGCP
ncbi:MAG: GC-type dockerin domain-anchored protein [Phycisphaerales bacterium]